MNLAICDPPCQNLGFCVAPNVCNCPDDFEGEYCEIEKSSPCLDNPPTPKNSRVLCNEKECIASCNKGFELSGGSTKMKINCINGVWLPEKRRGDGVPDCKRILTFKSLIYI